MIRLSLIVTCLVISMMSIGCCGPIGCGGGSMGCNDCDGYGQSQIIGRPLDRLRNMKRTLTCGSGCGEVYVGEWRSTPPDCEDPCCGDQWVGGAVAARPFCWQPGMLLSGAGLYGGRYCSGAESSAPCGCGLDTCDDCCGFEGEYYEGDVISGGGCSSGNCGCASCDARGAMGSNTRMARGVPASDRMTRSASTRNMDAQVNRIRR